MEKREKIELNLERYITGLCGQLLGERGREVERGGEGK